MEPFHQSVLITHSLALSKKYSGTSSEYDFGNDLTIVLTFKGSSVPIMVVAHPERCYSGGSFRGRVKKSDLYHWVVPLKGFWAPTLLLSFVGHLSGKLFSSTTPLQLPPSGTLTRGPKGTGPVHHAWEPSSLWAKIHHLSIHWLLQAFHFRSRKLASILSNILSVFSWKYREFFFLIFKGLRPLKL